MSINEDKFEELVDNQVDKLVDKLSKTEKIVFAYCYLNRKKVRKYTKK